MPLQQISVGILHATLCTELLELFPLIQTVLSKCYFIKGNLVLENGCHIQDWQKEGLNQILQIFYTKTSDLFNSKMIIDPECSKVVFNACCNFSVSMEMV